MVKKKPKYHGPVHMNERIGMKWAEAREKKRDAYRERRGHTIVTDTNNTNSSTPNYRKDPYSIRWIRSREDVDESVACFTWPTKQYNRKADFYFQVLLSNQDLLLGYYHKLMKTHFGVEHILMSEKTSISRNPIAKNTVNRIIKPSKKEQHVSKNVETMDRVTPTTKPRTELSTWILDWDYVDFHDGYFVIIAPDTAALRFKPLKVPCVKSRTSFDLIRKYIKAKVPVVFCDIVNGSLLINNTIMLEKAIDVICHVARERGIMVNPAKESNDSFNVIPFSQALSNAAKMTPEEFKKFKSRYIDYLVSIQINKYRIIPCIERLSHTRGETLEQAFMFAVQCNNGDILVVYENVNPNRSTLLFVVSQEGFHRNIECIYDFLNSEQVNKRSNIRNNRIDIKRASIKSYDSINHEVFDYWKACISAYRETKMRSYSNPTMKSSKR